MPRIVSLLVGLFTAVMFTAGPAAADGLHLTRYDDGTPYGWTGGCRAKFHIDPAAEGYRGSITNAVGVLSERTGIQFIEVGSSEEANLTYYQLDEFTLPGTETAYAYAYAGNVYLHNPDNRPVPIVDRRLRLIYDYRTALHETMHWLGIGHDPEADTDEIMGLTNTGLTADRLLHFGEGDIEGLNYVSNLNGCTPNTTPPPPFASTERIVSVHAPWRTPHRPRSVTPSGDTFAGAH